jgi:hypothetical protein
MCGQAKKNLHERNFFAHQKHFVIVRQHAMFLLDEKIRFSAKGQTGDKTLFFSFEGANEISNFGHETHRATAISDGYGAIGTLKPPTVTSIQGHSGTALQ